MISVGACRLRARGPQAGTPEREPPRVRRPMITSCARMRPQLATPRTEPVFMFAESAVQVVGEDGEEQLAAYCRARPAGFQRPRDWALTDESLDSHGQASATSGARYTWRRGGGVVARASPTTDASAFVSRRGRSGRRSPDLHPAPGGGSNSVR
jgi:hypothetical protein